MPQKSPAVSKQDEERAEGRAKQVRALVFPQMVRLPGYSGASNEWIAGSPDGLHRNAIFVDSILEYKDDFIIDGMWFVPRSAILSRKY